MKKCPICGREYDQGVTCPSCGMVLIDTESDQAVNVAQEQRKAKIRQKEEQKQQKEEERQKKADERMQKAEERQDSGGRQVNLSPKLLIIIAFCAAVLVICICAVLIVGKKRGSQQQYVSQTEMANADPTEEEYHLTMITDSLTFTSAGEVRAISVNTNIEDLSEIHWYSDDDSVAEVDADGQVTAIAPGETVITAYWNGIGAECYVSCEFTVSDEPEDSDGAEDSAESAETAEEQDTETSQSQLMIDASVRADYSANLDPDEYYDYSSEDFSFSYPANLYNYGVETTESCATAAGINVRDVLLTGDDGVSEAHFNCSVRTDSSSSAGFMRNLYDYYENCLFFVQDISYSEEKGRFIVTGYNDSAETEAVYLLVRVESDRVYTMEIVFPYNGDPDSEDYSIKSYVVENFYRTCSFSGSTYRARSYSQYLSGDTGEQY